MEGVENDLAKTAGDIKKSLLHSHLSQVGVATFTLSMQDKQHNIAATASTYHHRQPLIYNLVAINHYY